MTYKHIIFFIRHINTTFFLKWHINTSIKLSDIHMCFINDNICPLILKRHMYTFHISFVCRIIFNAHIHVMYYKQPCRLQPTTSYHTVSWRWQAEMECVIRLLWDCMYGVEKTAVEWRLENCDKVNKYLNISPLDWLNFEVSFHKQSLNQLHYLLTPTHTWMRKWDEMAKQNVCDFERCARYRIWFDT